MERCPNRPACLSHWPAGFTLYEAVITLTIGITLFGIGVPTFQTLVRDERLTTSVNTFVATLHLARSHAVLRQQRAGLCPSRDGVRCDDTCAWESGWIVYADVNGNRERDPEEALIQVAGAGGRRVTIRSTAGRRRITYQPTGFAGGANLTVTFCDARGPDAARAVILSGSGRPRVARRGPGGRALDCS